MIESLLYQNVLLGYLTRDHQQTQYIGFVWGWSNIIKPTQEQYVAFVAYPSRGQNYGHSFTINSQTSHIKQMRISACTRSF